MSLLIKLITGFNSRILGASLPRPGIGDGLVEIDIALTES